MAGKTKKKGKKNREKSRCKASKPVFQLYFLGLGLHKGRLSCSMARSMPYNGNIVPSSPWCCTFPYGEA